MKNSQILGKKMLQSTKHITLVGAGLIGSLLAIILAKRGYSVNVYERRPDMRREKIIAGRSINLALSDRGWLALELAGVGDDIRKVAVPMPGRMVHNVDSSVVFQPYGKGNQAINSVSRGGLNMTLMKLADEFPNVQFFFNHRCADIDHDTATAHFHNDITGADVAVKSDLVIGSDGAFSAVRMRLQKNDRFDFSQTYIPHGYKELTISAAPDGGFLMEKNALHIWPRGDFMLIALPNQNGTFTCTLFLPFEGNPSFEMLKTKQDVQKFFEETFPDAIALMPTYLDDFFMNPTSSLCLIRCFPWSYKDKVMLIGDSAHAIVPFYGQGMIAGFEDCRVLNELLDKYNDDWAVVLPEYERSRKPNGDAIADLALRNFVEMRDLVAQPEFLLRKKIESVLSQKFPEKYVPLYTLVTFSPHVEYKDALAESKKQDALFAKIFAMPDVEKRWQTVEFEAELEQIMANY